jgi:hypothetical protein
MKRWTGRYCTLAALLALGAGTVARADNTLTGITVTSPAPNDICIMDGVSYKITYTGGDPVQNIQWKYTCTDCTPQTPVNWFYGPYTQVNTTENKLGNFTIEAIVTFQRYPMGGTYTQTKSVDIVVNPPDNVVLANGAAVTGVNLSPVPPGGGPNTAFKFTMRRGSRAVACGGTPCEFVDYADPAYVDQQWTDPVPYMTIYMDTITDWKGMLGDAAYQANANLSIVQVIDQNLGVKLPTGCGGTSEIHFPQTFHFRFKKIDNNNFQILSP